MEDKVRQLDHDNETWLKMPARMSDKDFRLLGQFIQQEYGIKMPPYKKIMLESRLFKRLKHLGMASYSQYCDYIFTPEGFEAELVHMIDVVTTNKTDFFREPDHFDYLAQHVLPELTLRFDISAKAKLSVWSAGCSSGEEAYTIAIILSEFARRAPDFDFTILASDLCSQALDRGRLGIYESDRVEPVPVPLKERYFMKSKDESKNLLRVVPELRAKVKFRRLNLIDPDLALSRPAHIIFCRNVIIYFDQPTQEKLLSRLSENLLPGGYLILGHSETLTGLNLPLAYAAPTVYRRPR